MGSSFTKTDWEFVKSRATSVTAQLRAKGAEVSAFEAFPPVTYKQVDEFLEATGEILPADLIEFVTRFAGGWNFSWSSISKGTRESLQPQGWGAFGGNAEVPFIGVTRDSTLLKIYNDFQSELRMHLPEPQSRPELHLLFPLHSWDGGGGDYTAIQLNSPLQNVLYLDHEIKWVARHDRILGTGFREFVLGWATLGFPNCEYHRYWVDGNSCQPNPSGSSARRWLEWLAE